MTAEMIMTNETEIVGHGGIAKALKGIDKPFLFFASGVADSRETREAEFDRERQLLLSQDPSKHLVYFTSICVLTTPDTRYAQHKLEMENLVRENFPRHTLVRLGNCAWGSNTHQLVPFLRDKLSKDEPFDVYDEYRHYLSLDEFRYWVNLIPEDRSSEIMVTGERMKVTQIVERVRYELGL